MGFPARTGFKELIDIRAENGFASWPITVPENPLRCSDFSITPSQPVATPELIQGGVDRTAYQIDARVVEGSVAFPLVAKVGSAATVGTPPGSTADFSTVDPGVDLIFTNAITNANLATTLYDVFEVGSTYHGVFKNCMVNDIGIAGEEGGPINISTTIWPTHISGDYDDDSIETEGDYPTDYFNLDEVEVIMFYNVRINGGNSITIGDWSLAPCLIRSFNVNVANNLIRNFTYCNYEWAHDITFGLREVTGDFTFQIDWNQVNNPTGGRFPRFADIMSKASGVPELTFEMGGGAVIGYTYTITVRNPIFEAANQPISVGVLTQTVNYRAVADGTDYAIDYTVG